MLPTQLGLFGNQELGFDSRFERLSRTWLGEGAWFDYATEWVSGHARLFERLLASVRFRQESRRMYERNVEVPRLIAVFPEDGPVDPLLEQMQRALSQRYGESFERLSVALYRDGRDSVAFHGDTVARQLPEAVVATVSLGEPRRFLLRPTGGGRSLALSLGSGDLLVMGGSCQRTFQHSIPKIAHAGPRMALMFRPHWEDPATTSPVHASSSNALARSFTRGDDHTRKHQGGGR